MNTITIKGRIPFLYGWIQWPVNKKIEAPASWNELTKKQLYKIAEIIHSERYLIDGKIRLVVAVLGIRLMLFLKLNASQVYDLLPLAKFVMNDNELTINLVPKLRISFTYYYGPNDRLSNITIEEFSFLDTFFIRYKETGDNLWLNLLCSAMYRPKRADYNPTAETYKGDIRVDFNKHLVFYSAHRFESLSSAQKYAILLFYDGCRNQITKKYWNIFGQKKTSGKSFGWGGVLMELAGNKFGDHERTKTANLLDVLNHLEMEGIKTKKSKSYQKLIMRKYARRK